MTSLYSRLLATAFILFCGQQSFAQSPALVWQHSLGGSAADEGVAIIQTRDGGYVTAGNTMSVDGNVNGNHGGEDIWLVKLGATGAIQWQKCIGGTGDESVGTVKQTMDGGLIVIGTTTSNDCDISGLHIDTSIFINMREDVLVVKLNAAGTIEWQRCLGGKMADIGASIAQTADSGYILTGSTSSVDGDVSGLQGSGDAWVVKLSPMGAIQWQRCVGGPDVEAGTAIVATADGGYMLAGRTNANTNIGNASGGHGGVDAWIVKLDSAGGLMWHKCFGDNNDQEAKCIQQTKDGGYVMICDYMSCSLLSQGSLIKLSNTGAIEWQRPLYNYASEASLSDVQQTVDSGYILACYGNADGRYSGCDYRIVKLGADGLTQWEKYMGGGNTDMAMAIAQTADNGFIITGIGRSSDGDQQGVHGYLTSDIWVVKLSADLPAAVGDIQAQIHTSVLFPNPAGDVVHVSGAPYEHYRLLDAAGRALLAGGSSTAIDVHTIAPGNYFMELSYKDGSKEIIKMVKK